MKIKAPLLRAILAIALCAVGSSIARADGGRGRHQKLYAVPAPGKVVIDGKLDDWDLSGQIFIYVVSETAEMQSARFAMMYDKDALYLSGVVRDPSPMMNRHDPNVDPEKAWDADVCQIFLNFDPTMGYPVNLSNLRDAGDGRVGTIFLWHYTDRQEACLSAFRGMAFTEPLRKDLHPKGVIPHDKFQAVYVKAADGRGYTFEYRIPYATLGMKRALQANDILAATACFFWGTPDGLKTAGGAAWAYDVMARSGFPWQDSGCWGKIIFSEKGKLPKELVEEGLPPEQPLPLTFKYNVPEDSEVSITLFGSTGIVARTLVAQGARRAGENIERWDGLDTSGKPLPAGAYTWKGVYHQPIKTKFLFSAHNSGQPPYKTDDNTGGWGGDHGTPSAVTPAGDAIILTWNVSESGWGIIKTDLNGRKLWGIKHNAIDIACDGERIFVAGDTGFDGAWSVELFDAKEGRPLNWGNGKSALDPPPGGNVTNNVATAVACGNGKVYVSWRARNLVGAYDAQSGTLKESWPITAPQRLAVRPDGSVALISEGKVLAVDKGQSKVLIADHLDLSENVTIRSDGVRQAPSGITVAPDGSIYVANAGKLQNISVFDKDGKYLRSIGKPGGRPAVGPYDRNGIYMPGGICLDKNGRLWVAETTDSPKRHSVWDTKTGALVTEFFGGSAYFSWAWIDPKHPDEIYCHNVLWKIDWAKNTCAPISTIWRATKPNMIAAPCPEGYAGHFRLMTAKNGKQFGWGQTDYSGTLYMRDGDIFKPIAGTIRVAFGAYGSGLLYPVMKDIYEKTKAGDFLWQDANNDQMVQETELVVSPSGHGENTFNWIDPDLNVWCDAGWIYKPVRFEADGRPVYDFSKSEPIPWKGSNCNATSLYLDNQDDTVYTLNPGQQPVFAHWTRDGKLLWGYNGIVPWDTALNLPMITPGKLHGLTMPLGVAGDFTGAACYFAPFHIFTRDGIYVAMVMRDGRDGKGLGPDLIADENVTGQFVKPDGMNRYFILAGDQDGRVTEILGLETVKRLPGGAYLHTEENVKMAAAALAEYEQAKTRGQRLEIVRGRNGLPSAKAVNRIVDANRAFTARTAYDEKNLYIAYDVTSPVGLVNEITDPHLIFKGGNLLDIQLAADSQADPNRKTPAPGDARILVTRQKGKPVAVVFRPKVKDFKGEPIVLTSGTGKESFDAIEVTDKINLDYAKTQAGFRAIVTIPLAVIGWTPRPGATVQMDFGYIFGNATGQAVSLRAYWSNNSFSANVVADVPNESRLEPKEWGLATVE
ncbi:MAG: hypothetical protein HY360_10695 [Verrucomicrobia bacterium]|nr:hypothetical protein [Verrucomicrobiota bacterium]